jgi:CHASE2 domain-containing sensor protein
MKWRTKLSSSWRSALAGAVLCIALGLGLLRWGHELVYLSYDLLFVFRNPPPLDEIVIVYMDDRSFNELKQDNISYWDRNLHAALLDRLTLDHAKLVVFDVVLDVPGEPSVNTNLARAIQRNGNVVLAAALDSYARAQIQARNSVLPLPEFLQAAAGWGITEVMSPEKAVVRQYFIGTETQPSLPWKAAMLAGAEITKISGAVQPETWLNYYGPALTLPHMSYCEVTNQPAGSFRDKVVFVGARPKTLKAGDEADAFRTPHTLWERQFMPGVEVTATAFLNLLRNDGLTFWPWPKQVLFVALAGLFFGSILGLFRPLPAAGLAVAGIAGLLIAALALAHRHVWFPWTVAAFAQIPAALAWSVRCHFHRLKFEKDVLERTLAETSRRTDAVATMPQKSGTEIPDHTLLRCVGKGAYGEVWLARNAVGIFHAVKIVRRRDFPSDGPYEREFKGIQKFMPVSRSHPGLVHVLHVGRNDAAGFFFYVMEAADDHTGQKEVDPESYWPRTLAAELHRRRKLPPPECLQLGLSLSEALEHLHQQGLVHRDIKPGNIIYVNGAPKLADIGLVSEQRGQEKNASLVGTEGYVPPEGPGAPAADVYALGKLLYEACLGRDRLLFPEVPSTFWEQSYDSLLRQLNQVIGKACETNVEERYGSAGELHAALVKLRGQGSKSSS